MKLERACRVAVCARQLFVTPVASCCPSDFLPLRVAQLGDIISLFILSHCPNPFAVSLTHAYIHSIVATFPAYIGL